MVRVRFAPSPTGYFHVGSARTALFNWLFARNAKGTFVLRIEDTDQERSTEESIAQIHESLRWIGVDWDEYYRQTDRFHVHLKAAEGLMEKDLAYELDGAWWFRVPMDGTTVVQDDLLGDVVYRNDHLKDFVIRRSDGSFIYHFAVVVDDADMEISHVIRGDDHLNNAPKHILLFEALGKPVPRFAHIPMLLGDDREKLSKRHGAASLLEYRDAGYLPEAMINFLARLGWSHGDEEIFSVGELIEKFSISGINKSGAVLDEEKLRWVSQQHLKRADLARLVDLTKPFVLKRGRVSERAWDEADPQHLQHGADLLRDRSHTLEDLAWAMEMLFPIPLDRVDEMKLEPRQKELMTALADALEEADSFTASEAETLIRDTLSAQNAKLKDVALAARLAVTGRRAGPGLFDIIDATGPGIAADRLRTYEGEGAP